MLTVRLEQCQKTTAVCSGSVSFKLTHYPAVPPQSVLPFFATQLDHVREREGSDWPAFLCSQASPPFLDLFRGSLCVTAWDDLQ
jgi:hypothetical protein